MIKLVRTRAGDLVVGSQFVEIDDDSLVTTDQINANYDAEDQDWLEVIEMGGYADIGWIRVNVGHTTATLRGDWDQYVWERVEVAR